MQERFRRFRELAEPPDLNGIHLTLAVEKRAIQVYVAPASFLRAFDITFVKGDRLHVSGSKIRFRGADLVLTREVRRDTDVLTVRDEQGNPYWSGESAVGRFAAHDSRHTLTRRRSGVTVE